jgi:predicted phosphoribosyltransferase
MSLLFGVQPLFADRAAAGRQLVERFESLRGQPDIVVLALPRGGLPVAYELARGLGADLDVLLVGKLGAPGNPEFAIGAVASDGTVVLDQASIQELGIGQDYISEELARQQDKIESRLATYREGQEKPAIRGRTVILVDDGVATGATARAALQALRQRGPARLILAVPVGPAETIAALAKLADQVVVLAQPDPFLSVGRFYEDFSQVSDDQVIHILRTFRAGSPGTAAD